MKTDPELEAIIDRQTQEINRQGQEINRLNLVVLSLNSRINYLHEKYSREKGALMRGFHPAKKPMVDGFHLDQFMPGITPEDALAMAEALDAWTEELGA